MQFENEEFNQNKQVIYDIFETKKAVPLDDLTSIEDVLYTIADLQKKVEFYKDLKEKRISPLDRAIASNGERIDLLKQTILETLKMFNEKSLNFPGVGKVTSKKSPSKWVIDDEGKLLEALKVAGEYDNLTSTEVSIKKREVTKLLDAWDKVNKLPADCVHQEGGKDSVSVTIEKDKDIPVPKKEVETTEETAPVTPRDIESYDKLEI